MNTHLNWALPCGTYVQVLILLVGTAVSDTALHILESVVDSSDHQSLVGVLRALGFIVRPHPGDWVLTSIGDCLKEAN